MRVLVTADRDYDDEFIIYALLSGILTMTEELVVIEGGADGGDKIAREFVEELNRGNPRLPIRVITEEAEWDKYGKSAGPIRNRRMYNEHKPEVVIAFHDDLEHSKGTKDMVAYAVSQGAVVYHVRRLVRPDFDTTA